MRSTIGSMEITKQCEINIQNEKHNLEEKISVPAFQESWRYFDKNCSISKYFRLSLAISAF